MKKLTKLLFAGFLAMAVAPAAVLSLASMKEPTQVKAENVETPVIVSVGGKTVDQETNMGGAPTVIIGQPYSAQVVATGGELSFSAGAGGYMALPSGLSIDPSTGLISGTCDEPEKARINSYITVTNPAGEAHAVIGMAVVDSSIAPTFETPEGSLGTIYTNSYSAFNINVQEGADFLDDLQWSLQSGSLPVGMNLTSKFTHATIGGYPTTAGTYTFTIKAENELGSAQRQFSITVSAASVAPHVIEDFEYIWPDAIVGQPYELQLEASGTNTNEDPIIWSLGDDFTHDSYDLGQGLSLSSTGLVSGTPTVAGQLHPGFIYVKNNEGQHYCDPYINIYDDGAVTSVSVSPAETAVQKTKSKQFSAQVSGYGNVSQVVEWDTSLYLEELHGWAPRPTSDDTTLVDGLLTIGEDEEREQICVVAISGSTKGYAIVNVVEKGADLFTVTFDSNGGSGTYGPFEYASGYEFTLPAANTFTPQSGKHFLNWEVKIGSAEPVNKNPNEAIIITAATTIKAIWENDALPTYSVTYVKGDGQGNDYVVSDIEEGQTHTLLNFNATGLTAPDGYQFSAWSLDGQQRQPGYEFEVTENKTVTALYELIPVQKYSVTYQANGGTGSNYVVSDIEEGSKHALVSFATSGFVAPSGKEFKCWSVGGEEKAPGTEITVDANKTVLAVWKDSQVDPEKTLSSITLSGNQKTEFTVGDTFSAEGLVVTAHYSDDSSETIDLNNVEISGYNMNQEGKQTVTVSYQGKTATYEITVKAKDTPVTPDDPVTPNKSSGLPVGAVVGIVIGSALVVGVGGFALVWFVIKKKTWADFLALFKKK